MELPTPRNSSMHTNEIHSEDTSVSERTSNRDDIESDSLGGHSMSFGSRSKLNEFLVREFRQTSTDEGVEILLSSYLVAVWCGVPLLTGKNSPIQKYYDALFFIALFLIGWLYSLYLVSNNGFVSNAMWIFLMAMCSGAWFGLLWGSRFHKGYTHTTKYKSVWYIDGCLGVIMVIMLVAISYVYFDQLATLVRDSQTATGDAVEYLHGSTQWVRVGAVAVPSMAYISSALELTFDMIHLKLETTRMIEDVSKIDRTMRITLQLEGNTLPIDEKRATQLIEKWVACEKRVQLFCRRYAFFFCSVVLTSALAFFAWFVSSVSGDTVVDSLVSGVVIFSFMIICVMVIFVSAYLTSSQRKCAMIISEFCFHTPFLRKARAWIPNYVNQHLIIRDLGVNFFGISVDWRFFVSFLSIVFTGSFSILKIKDSRI